MNIQLNTKSIEREAASALVVYLYSAIPQDLAHQLREFSWPQKFKRSLRWFYICLNWILRRRLVGHFSDLTSESFANLGDIALSSAAREHLAGHLAPWKVEFREIPWGALNPATIDEINESATA